MGYTHYWRRPKEFDATRFLKFVEDVRRLYAALPKRSEAHEGYAESPLRVAGWGGRGKPEFRAGRVAFNGRGSLSHESFRMDRVMKDCKPQDGRCFDFCKTARKPYDLLVCAALIALKRHFPEVEVTSDGGPQEWAKAVKFYERVIGPAPVDGPWM